jgi:hypothetical protein
VDSIALTYAMLGPLMAVLRPAAALITGIAAGLALQLTDDKKQIEVLPAAPT